MFERWRIDVPPAETRVAEDRFHCQPHVVSARAGDATVLMDRKRGAYFTLNEVGGRVWELAGMGSTASEMVERLLEEYDVSQEQLEVDVAATIRQLHHGRLIAKGPSAPLPHAVKPAPLRKGGAIGELKLPSVFCCALMIFVAKAMLRTRGFDWTIKWICRRGEGVPVREVGDETVKAIDHRIAMASALYPGRALCLEQSLTLYYCLLRAGIQSVLRLGTKPYPFEAHAWVERGGDPVNDLPEHVANFIPLPDPLS